MSALPGAGFAAGPCLLKDTLQFAAISNHQFGLGYAAINVNEGLPAYVVDDIRRRFPLASMTVGILGMAFKAGSDDVRSSLSYKLKKLLRLTARDVLTTRPLRHHRCHPAPARGGHRAKRSPGDRGTAP